MFCNRCGKQIEDSAIFCTYCGKKAEYSPERKTENKPERTLGQRSQRRPEQYRDRQGSNLNKGIKKSARRKSIIAVLLSVGVVIICCTVLFFTLKGKNSSAEDDENKKGHTSSKSVDNDEESIEPEEDEKSSAGGEVNTGTLQEESNQVKSYRYADSPEEAFANYMDVFTSAVNTGDYSNANSVMVAGSPLYKQQQGLVNELYSKNITEQVESFSVQSIQQINSAKVRLISNEEVKVFYKDGTTKVLNQNYEYICELTEDGWLFTNIEEVQ